MAYWYEKDSGSLLRFEKECYLQFMRDYNHPDQRLTFFFDKQRRFCVDIALPFKAAPEIPWRTFEFHIVYEHAYPFRLDETIKVFPMMQLKHEYHLVHDTVTGLPCLSLAYANQSAEVQGHIIIVRLLRWISAYSILEINSIAAGE